MNNPEIITILLSQANKAIKQCPGNSIISKSLFYGLKHALLVRLNELGYVKPLWCEVDSDGKKLIVLDVFGHIFHQPQEDYWLSYGERPVKGNYMRPFAKFKQPGTVLRESIDSLREFLKDENDLEHYRDKDWKWIVRFLYPEIEFKGINLCVKRHKCHGFELRCGDKVVQYSTKYLMKNWDSVLQRLI